MSYNKLQMEKGPPFELAYVGEIKSTRQLMLNVTEPAHHDNKILHPCEEGLPWSLTPSMKNPILYSSSSAAAHEYTPVILLMIIMLATPRDVPNDRIVISCSRLIYHIVGIVGDISYSIHKVNIVGVDLELILEIDEPKDQFESALVASCYCFHYEEKKGPWFPVEGNKVSSGSGHFKESNPTNLMRNKCSQRDVF